MAGSERKRRKPKPGKPAADPKPSPTPADEGWQHSPSDFTFSEEAPVTGKLILPASGTAEEILAREAVQRAGTASVPKPPAGDAVPAAQPTLSFFTSAQARDEQKAVEASEHLATFLLDREEYGVDVKLVQEIIRVSEITQVPRAPEFIRGVINLRGRIIPVIDLKRKLGLGENLPGRAARIVVVKVRERLIGLLVDAASQVLRVPLSSIEAAPEEVVEIDLNFIRGVAKLQGRLIILIDLPKVLAIELKAAFGIEAAS
jgi:purine-binding chemotaxis protein CheW